MAKQQQNQPANGDDVEFGRNDTSPAAEPGREQDRRQKQEEEPTPVDQPNQM